MKAPITIAPLSRGILKASKYIKIQCLLSSEELRELFTLLGELLLIYNHSPASLKEAILSAEDLFYFYEEYITAVKQEQGINFKPFGKKFSFLMTQDRDAIFAAPIEEDRYLIHSTRPIIQCQHHQFFVSGLDGEYHSMVLSPESISWGLQFSYPQLYQDPVTLEIQKVMDRVSFPNTEIFHKLQRFIREKTLPTGFEFMGQKKYVPFRIGKECLPWIGRHPQLKARGLTVINSIGGLDEDLCALLSSPSEMKS